MAKVEILKQETLLGKQFNIYGDFENPLFLAKDVAEWIEHSDVSTMVRTVDEDEKLIQTIFVSGQNREVILLTENGVYEVLMQSRKPIAKQFKKGVKEILKSIRKHGLYATPNTVEKMLSDPDTAIKLLETIKEERSMRLEAETKNRENAPKVLFADAIVASDNSVLIGKLANVLKQNGIDIGQNRLFKWLREHGYLCKYGERYNQPTQKSMELELFEVSYNTVVRADKSIQTITTKVTGKGQIYFINKFLNDRQIA